MSFREVKQDMFNSNYMMVASGPNLKSSIFIFDENFNLLPNQNDLLGIKIKDMAETQAEKHLFAIDIDGNLIAMDMCLVCKDNAPYKMLSLPDDNAVLRVDKKNICILYASGNV